MTWWPGARARLFCHSSQMDSIIQWNCPGLKINFREITILVQANSSLSSVQLKNVTNQLNTPLIIMGDITPYRISKQQRQKTWSLSLPGRIMYLLRRYWYIFTPWEWVLFSHWYIWYWFISSSRFCMEYKYILLK